MLHLGYHARGLGSNSVRACTSNSPACTGPSVRILMIWRGQSRQTSLSPAPYLHDCNLPQATGHILEHLDSQSRFHSNPNHGGVREHTLAVVNPALLSAHAHATEVELWWSMTIAPSSRSDAATRDVYSPQELTAKNALSHIPCSS